MVERIPKSKKNKKKNENITLLLPLWQSEIAPDEWMFIMFYKYKIVRVYEPDANTRKTK